MRKNIRRAILMLVLLPLPVLHACSDDITGNEGIQTGAVRGRPDQPTLIVFPESMTLLPGESAQLGAVMEGWEGDEVFPEVTLVWTSSDPEVLAVSGDGWVTALREGETLVVARYGDLTGQARVVVRR